MAGRVAIVVFCGAVTCVVALSACNRVAPPPPPPPSNPGGGTSVVTTPSATVVTTTPPADGTTKLVIPTVGLPAQSSTVRRGEPCGIPGAVCHLPELTTSPPTSTSSRPSGGGASPTTTP
jgi:hypothetical protein